MTFAPQTDASQWHVVFLSAAAVFAVANTLFLLLGTAETQPWNELGLATPNSPSGHLQAVFSINVAPGQLAGADYKDADARLKDVS